MKLKAVKSFDSETIRVDPHVPLQIEWNGASTTPVYWRTGDLIRTLLEIGIDPDTGTIRSLTLVLPGPVEAGRSTDTLRGLPTEHGLPSTDILGAGARYFDEPHDLRVVHAGERLLVYWAEPGTIRRTITASRTRFGVDEQERIVAVEVVALNEEERATLSSSLEPTVENDPEPRGPRVTGVAAQAPGVGALGVKTEWIEVWVDEPSRGEFLRVVRGLADGRIVIVDPRTGEEVARFDDYEEATYWLGEDEYDRIEGRWTPP